MEYSKEDECRIITDRGSPSIARTYQVGSLCRGRHRGLFFVMGNHYLPLHLYRWEKSILKPFYENILIRMREL